MNEYVVKNQRIKLSLGPLVARMCSIYFIADKLWYGLARELKIAIWPWTSWPRCIGGFQNILSLAALQWGCEAWGWWKFLWVDGHRNSYCTGQKAHRAAVHKFMDVFASTLEANSIAIENPSYPGTRRARQCRNQSGNHQKPSTTSPHVSSPSLLPLLKLYHG